MSNNPYHHAFLSVAQSIRERRPEDVRRRPRIAHFVHWKAKNEWIHAEVAGTLLIHAYRLAHATLGPVERDRLVECCDAFVLDLLAAAVDDRWFHHGEGMGDPNVDRFTLLPFLESFALIGSDLPTSTREAFRSGVCRILDVQYREYGSGGAESELRGPYPNMDAYYAMIMGLGYRVSDNPRHAADCRVFLERLASAQFKEGAWTYIRGTNECPVYHDINVLLMARLHAVTGEAAAFEQVRRSLPYYPRAVMPNGVVEYHSDCWWKHGWSRPMSHAPDTVASLLGDGENRWIGDRLRDATLQHFQRVYTEEQGGAPDNALCVLLYYAARFWRPVPTVSPARQWVIVDRNIEGPRGRFPDWSWAASARFGCDTLVGAVAHRLDRDTEVCALMAVTPEIPFWPPDGPFSGNGRMNLCIPPPGTRGRSTVLEDQAEFEAEYPMACTRMVFGAEPFPYAWRCRQHWRLSQDQMVGVIHMTSERNQRSRPPAVRIRFGRNATLKPDGTEGGYAFGPLHLRLDAPDFLFRTILPAPVMLTSLRQDAVELRLTAFEDEDERDFRQGHTVQACVTISIKTQD